MNEMPCFSLECERESVITSAISKYIQDLTKLFLPLLTVKPLSNRTYKSQLVTWPGNILGGCGRDAIQVDAVEALFPCYQNTWWY